RPRQGAYTPPYRNNPRIAPEPIMQKKILRKDGFLPRPWSAEEGTNRCSTTGDLDHEARTLRWPAVSGAGAGGRERRHLGRGRRLGARKAQAAREQADGVRRRHVRVRLQGHPRLAVRS